MHNAIYVRTYVHVTMQQNRLQSGDQMLLRHLRLLFWLLLFAAIAPFALASRPERPQPNNVWQFSIPLEPTTDRRAYLWIPPHCHHVRGVLVGLQNMLERPMFEDPTIRAAVADSDMPIVWISPGAWPGKLATPAQPSLAFTPEADAIAALQQVLTRLGEESGYTELEYAPLIVTGHSAAGPFVWGLAQALPNRVFAALPYKSTIFKQYTPVGVPILYVAQEWAEWGVNWGEAWHRDFLEAQSFRKRDPRTLLGDFADIGAGHFDFNHQSASVLALFIRKAAQYRLPAHAQDDVPVSLKPISAESGVLVDPVGLGTTDFKAVPYREWKMDPADAFWYFDAEMADAVNAYMLKGLHRKPQAIDFIANGSPVPLLAPLKPEFLKDGITFRVHAESLAQSPSSKLYGGAALGHSSSPITYRVSSGAIMQTGADTFRVAARSGGLTRQGMPWEPWIMAVQPGDAQYRSTDKPAHILIDVLNKQGTPQSIAFTPLSSVSAGTELVPLHATASSGLPVDFFVESGPAIVEGDHLRLLSIPPRTRFPVKVIIGAFQWGRVGNQPVQSTGPVVEEFYIRSALR